MNAYQPRHRAPSGRAAALSRRPGLFAGALAAVLVLALLLTSFIVRPAAADTVADPTTAVSVRLAYPDNKDHTDGVTVQPGTEFSGTIRLNEATSPSKDATNLKVTLRVPKEHVTSISVLRDSKATSSDKLPYTISPITSDGDDWAITITWQTYEHSGTYTFPFSMTVANGETPDGFVTHPVATITSDQNPDVTKSNSLTVTAKYPKTTLTKLANGRESDNTTVVGTSVDATLNGTTYIPEGSATTMTFSFNSNKNISSLRTLSSATLTDTLPVYKDYLGSTRRASFNAAANPDWKLSADGETVTYKKTGNSNTLANSFPSLKLSFPGLPLTEKGTFTVDGQTKNYHYASVTNSATVTTEVPNLASGEQAPTATDSISLNVASKEYAEAPSNGFLAVYVASSGANYQTVNVSNTPTNRGKEFAWAFDATNSLQYPMKNVELHNDSAVSGYGLDSRLKVTGITSISINGLSDSEVLKNIDSVCAYEADGDGTCKPQTLDSSSGKLSVTFDSSATYSGFSIKFKPDWKWPVGSNINVHASSSLRDPDAASWNTLESPNNVLKNTARMSGTMLSETLNSDGTSEYTELGTSVASGWAQYVLTPFTEKLQIVHTGIDIYDWKTATVNSSKLVIYGIKGTLDSEKKYQNLRVVLLLPAGMTYTSYANTAAAYGNKVDVSNLVDKKSITTVSNFNGTEMTKVTIPLDQSIAKQFMSGTSDTWQAWLEFNVNITDDSDTENPNVMVGYITADNAPDPGTETGFTDYSTPLPSSTGEGVYPDSYKIGPHTNISAVSSAYTVTAASGTHAQQTVQNDTAASKPNKQGVSAKAGDDLTYNLLVSSGGGASTNTRIFDALPSTSNGSKFNVRLRSFPTLQDEYKNSYRLLYTTDSSASTASTADTVDSVVNNNSLWKSESELTAENKSAADVTAILLVPTDETAKTPDFLRLSLPVSIPSDISVKSTDYKTNPLDGIGLIAAPEARNNFWYSTQTVVWKQSNSSYARLGAIAGFVVKKVSADDSPLSGATFSFPTSEGDTTSSETTNDSGHATFYGLQPSDGTTSLTRSLSETQAPDGYLPADDLKIKVEKAGDTLKMTCTTKSGGACSGSGTNEDPFVVMDMKANASLPFTGSNKLVVLLAGIAGSLLLLSLVAVGIYARRRREI